MFSSALLLACLSTAPAPNGDPFLSLYAETRAFQSGRPVSAKATADGKAVLFLRAQPKSPEQTLFLFDVQTGQARELLSPAQVLAGAAEGLSSAERARLERQRITARGFTSYQLSEDGQTALVTLSGKLYLVSIQGAGDGTRPGRALQLHLDEGPVIDPRFSPDGRQVAYVRNNDVHVIDLKSGRERQVTRGGTELAPHGLAEFVAQEEMDRFEGFWWSPDGKRIAYEESDHTHVEKFTIADPLRPEQGANAFAYPRSGKNNVAVRLGLISVAGGPTTWVKWDVERYPYLATVKWPKMGPLCVVVQNRAQTEEQLLAVDLKTGKTRELLTEKDGSWLNLQQGFPRWLDDGSGFFWFTERNGGPEIELRTARGERSATWISPGDGYASWVGFDEKRRILYFAGSADPTQSHLYRVREGQAPERVASDEAGPATESGVLSKDGSLLIITSTSTSHMPRTAVFRTDGGKVGDLPSVAIEPPLTPVLEFRKVGPQEGFWTAVLRPKNAPKGVKLPVVVDVYGGPGHLVVAHTMRQNLLPQWLADQGFLVVKIDGRGTPRRGRPFERFIKNNFAVTLDDQIAALKALANEVPEVDLTRVGIQGWSFGGYLAALGTLSRPDVFKSGVAGAPVVDWADYDTHYTERYLGTPGDNPAGYAKSSLLSYADKLERPLLLIHGTADDNVYFFHTIKLSDALFRAGKKHQVLPLANFTHMVPEPIVTQRLHALIAQHFKDTL